MERRTGTTRREFLKTSAAAGAVVGVGAMTGGLASAATRRSLSPLKVGIIGCGGRGTGAVVQALRADEGSVLWAMGDAFADKIGPCLENVRGAMNGSESKIEVADERQFAGFDAFQKVIDSGVDVVILTTPPVFRPQHLAAAIDAGKHVFCEKPIAVDAPGVRSVLETAKRAEAKGLSLMSGLCWRRQSQMQEVFGKVLDGGIGEVRAVQCTYNTTGWVTPHPRQDGWSDTEFQLRNWQYFTPMSGDHIVEQAIHAIDWISWAMAGRMPVKCTAVGGRQTRPDTPETGNVWDHFSATYEFEDGARGYHMCRHWPNTPADNTGYMLGTKGDCRVLPWRGLHTIKGVDGGSDWKGHAEKNDMYQQEHDELFAAIRAGTPINDGVFMSHTTLMSIMAREAAYTGQVVTWEQIMNSEQNLNPEPWAFGPRETPRVAMPGRTAFI